MLDLNKSPKKDFRLKVTILTFEGRLGGEKVHRAEEPLLGP
jgi:hypothetical protein